MASLVFEVTATIFHVPTCLYGSGEGSPESGVVDIRTTNVSNVFPIVQYSAYATINDRDTVPPIAHDDESTGDFVAMTIELSAGSTNSNVIVVSGASPYSDYVPMHYSEYNGVALEGDLLAQQTRDRGVQQSPSYTSTETTTTTSKNTTNPIPPISLMITIGAIVVIVMGLGAICVKEVNSLCFRLN
ncbi:MAG: hypothetical protein BAJATHORv1_30100 [Candidatus Thorarchaeota archaeon]|nr:MAG: hypothetical protein BAJATHORv1_30100 [Candidatus Thorarchaeota archaeon]